MYGFFAGIFIMALILSAKVIHDISRRIDNEVQRSCLIASIVIVLVFLSGALATYVITTERAVISTTQQE